MRIETPRYTERFGAVRLHDVQKVLELDSGGKEFLICQEVKGVEKIDEEVIKAIEGRMAVIVPVKDEKLGVKWIVHPYLFHVKDRGEIKIDWEHKELRWIQPGDIDNFETVPKLKETLARVYPDMQRQSDK